MKYFKARTGTSPPGPLIHSISSRFSGLVLEALPGAMMCTGGWRPLVQIEPDIKWSMRIESEQAFLSNLYQPFKSNNGWTKRSFAKNTVYWWASYCKLCVPLNMVWYYIRTWFIRRQNPSSSGVTPFDKLLSFFYVSEIWDDPSPGNHYETIDSNSPTFKTTDYCIVSVPSPSPGAPRLFHKLYHEIFDLQRAPTAPPINQRVNGKLKLSFVQFNKAFYITQPTHWPY